MVKVPGRLGAVSQDAMALATQGLTQFENQYAAKTASWATLPTTTKAKIEQIIRDAIAGPDTGSDYMAHMFYYSLADQLLTIAPRELIDAVWKYASYLNSPTNFIAEHPYNTNMRFGPECSPAWSGEDFGCSFVWFLSALYERQRAFIPISSEPGSTQPVLTEAGTVQIIAPASAGSQVIATPYSPTSQTAQVVTQPTYIPSAPAPDTGGLPTSYTPPPIYNAAAGATTSPNVQPATPAIPSAAPANSSWLLLAAIAGFVLLKKRKEQ